MTRDLKSITASRDELNREIVVRKLAEEDLQKALSELERSNRELEQFAYVASHDLQEPLRMVASYVRLLEKKYRGQLDEKADQYIHFAVDGALRMQKLIEGLLAYARIGRGGEFMPVDTNDVVSQVVSDLSESLQESRAVITKDDLPTVTGDETQLIHLFQNLIRNAVKFRKPEVPPQVHVSAKKEGKEWVFSVRDNGVGIDQAYAERIFLIFQRLHTREEYPGTGIGLALCKKIVERHHGRIWVESAPGEGATFFFTIPE
jgi:light-regulated signal transduction histidine kinase (bacteriophytochrome)